MSLRLSSHFAETASFKDSSDLLHIAESNGPFYVLMLLNLLAALDKLFFNTFVLVPYVLLLILFLTSLASPSQYLFLVPPHLPTVTFLSLPSFGP